MPRMHTHTCFVFFVSAFKKKRMQTVKCAYFCTEDLTVCIQDMLMRIVSSGRYYQHEPVQSSVAILDGCNRSSIAILLSNET